MTVSLLPPPKRGSRNGDEESLSIAFGKELFQKPAKRRKGIINKRSGAY